MKIIVLGYTPANDDGRLHVQDAIYSREGLCPTLTAQQYKDPKRIMVDD